METQFGIRALLQQHPIVPVVNFENVDDVEGFIDGLVQQNIHCIEITLRSACAMQAIEKALAIAPEGFDVGVGTIVNVDQVRACAQLGVKFMVSPGLNPTLSEAFIETKIPYLPGVMTPSEIINAQRLGCDTLKLFPFNLAGGITALKSYGKVFPNVLFCPTGGVNNDNYEEIAALSNVICVGGSGLGK